jgi:hypothetical protein
MTKELEPGFAYVAAERVAKRLEGTSDSLIRVFEQLDLDEGLENNSEFCARLDSLVFCCSVCDWWFEVGMTGADVNGQWACVECSPKDNDDD